MRICAITMVHNEAFFLPRWIAYYGGQLGRENLYVLDHGSTDGSTDDVGGANRMRLPRPEVDQQQRQTLVMDMVRGMLQFFDVVIYADCDDLLIPDPAKYDGLADYCARTQRPATYAIGVNVQQLVDVEPPLDRSAPILGQRRFCRLHLRMCKPLVTRVPIRWINGYHTSDQRPGMDPDLILFHMKYMDLAMCLQRLAYTRAMPWSERSLRLGRGRHQRIDDDALVRRFKKDAQAYRSGPLPFDFSLEASEINRNATIKDSGFWSFELDNPSKFMEIPERFFGIV